jgi:hypothetical protein
MVVAGAGIVWAREKRGPFLSLPLLVLAAMLKIYPVFALVGAAWAENGRRRIPWVLALVALAGYWFANAEEMTLITSKMHLGYGMSWGALTIFNRTQLENLSNFWLTAVVTYTAVFGLSVISGHALRQYFAGTAVTRTDWGLYWCRVSRPGGPG